LQDDLPAESFQINFLEKKTEIKFKRMSKTDLPIISLKAGNESQAHAKNS
jgi:hypothetical protein